MKKGTAKAMALGLVLLQLGCASDRSTLKEIAENQTTGSE